VTGREIASDEFRRALATLPTGVTVVTAVGENGRSGATANAVCSLSLEPVLMLACLDRGSRTLRSVQSAGRFGINVLGAGQEHLARQFATKDEEAAKWEGVGSHERDGIPVIEGCPAWIACDLEDVVGGGDHVIVTGAVRDLEVGEGEPLVFYGGAYRALNDDLA
jgi:3-hydroxy-9,10-secoandrosta-1,3,5(10)-triene-9,17-dione monooxygenase reductase component